MNNDIKQYIELPVRLSPTRVELAQRCYRRHVLSDLLQLKPVDIMKDPRWSATFGDILHECTRVFWLTMQKDMDRIVGMQAAQAVIRGQWEEKMPPGNTSYHTEDLMHEVVEGYAKGSSLAGNLGPDWVIHEMEERHSVTLAGGTEVTYQIDRLVRHPEDGRLAIVDTKSARTLSSKYFRYGYNESMQQRLYRALESWRVKQPITYSLIEGVQKQGTAGEVEYLNIGGVWQEAYINEGLLLLESVAQKDRSLLEAVQDLDDLEEKWHSLLLIALLHPDIVPFNLHDCNTYFSPCPYQDLCYSDPSEREGIALGEYHVDIKEY